MFGLPARAMSQGQDDHARSLIRLLKLYRRERANNTARREIALTIQRLAAQLAEMPDAGGIPPAPPRPQ
jgi:hypothetical protein